VFVYGAGVVLVRICGKIPAGAETDRITQHLSSSIAEAPKGVSVFFDLESFSHYHSEVRTRYTDAVLAHTSKVLRVWIYADSTMVRMGATVAGLVLRQLQLVDRQFFEAELARVMSR
jgi:hypothetical protein